MSVTERPKSEETKTTTRSADPRTANGFALLVSCASGVYAVPLAGRESFIIGRTPECDIVIADGSVSRQHARITVGDALTIEDLESTNGTRVHGQSIQPRLPVPIAVGTVFEIGSATCVLQRARSVDPGTPPLEPVTAARRALPQTDAPGGLIVADPAMRNLYALLDLVAPSPLAVLILGETGVGKEMYAEALHKRSPRATRKFLQLNCAALPESILEGELFGYERGAFTGAVHAKEGLFESADGGTVFLDEVGELPMATQAKLLRVLEMGQIMRLGSVIPRNVDVRIVSATNRDLRHAIAENRFRPDLYFRLNGMSVTLPPLRQRKADIAPLANAFAVRCAASMGRAVPTFSEDAIGAFERYDWPGNVRELRNVVERTLVIGRGTDIDLETLSHADPEAFGALHVRARLNPLTAPAAFAPVPAGQGASQGIDQTGRFRARDLPHAQPAESSGLRGEIQSLERQRILDALAKCAGNQTQAAKVLGISRYTLMNRLEAYGIARPRKR